MRTTLRGVVALTLAAMLTPLAAVSYEIPADSPIGDALRQADKAVQAIIAVPDGQRTFDNTLGALDDLRLQLQKEVWYTELMASVSDDSAKRDMGWQANRDESAWYTEFSKREDLYHAIKAFADSNPKLEGEQARYLERTLRDYRRSGMDLPLEKREQLKEIENKLSELGIEFDRNINEDPTRVHLTAEELVGVPEEVLKALEPQMSDDIYIVRLDYPIFTGIQNNCDNETTRHKIYLAGRRQAGQRNVDVLKKILKLRADYAHLLGYGNLAQYSLETNMAKDVDTVWKFYGELTPLVKQKARVDYDELLAAKREHTGDANAELHPWDQSFYENLLLREKYAVDNEKVREYLPLDAVLSAMFEITGKLYGLEWVDETETADPPVPFWHKDVKLYGVYDKATQKLMGHVYFDLFPREAKDQGAWCWGAVPRKTWVDGHEEVPLIVMLCNFSTAGEGTPPLLTHEQLVTFFHESGHMLHSLLSEARYYKFAGTSVSIDFVEMPSQMFENWAWDRDILKHYTRHYKDGEPLPDELIDSMISARNFCSGMKNLAQIWLGMTDMRYHTVNDGVVDTTKVGADTYGEVTLFTSAPNTFFEAGFGHLLGYQAGYYSYLWGLVYAHDVAAKVRSQGMLNPEAGMEFRKKILARGGTMDEMKMLEDYLGRPPEMGPFLESLGLKAGK
ncbi:MAG: Zn-dependent oligopeptidase [Phycisphaerae bacterium]|nr:Zn-dependent oligopeptidase [Phycisphaerae bacterium]